MTIEHSTLTGSDLHEPKGVAGASAQDVYIANGVGSGVWAPNYPKGAPTAVAGSLITSDGAGAASWERTQGWAQYQDTQTLVGTPTQTLATGVTQAFTCDGGNSTIEKNPSDAVASMWNVSTNKHVPIAAFDVYHVRVTFTAENYSGATPYIELELDIGGSIGVIYDSFVDLRKGGAATGVAFSFPVYTGTTYLANGGTFNLTYVGTGTCDIYKNAILIVRESKAYI